MTDPQRPGIGVWSDLPPTISAEAKVCAQLHQSMPVPGDGPPRTADQWRAANEAMLAWVNSSAAQQLLNVRPTTMSEWVVDGVSHVRFEPEDEGQRHTGRMFLHIHGGGYLAGAPQMEASILSPLVSRTGWPALAVRYPLWWEAEPPADVERVVAVYRHLLRTREASSIILSGTSAGGGLALRTALRLRAVGDPMPGAMVLFSPWVDLSRDGDSTRALIAYDTLVPEIWEAIARFAPEAQLRAPEYSPVCADLHGLPRTIIATGTRDALLSDCARLQRALTDGHVINDLRVYEGMWHAFNMFRMPESDVCVRDVCDFLQRHVP